VRLLVLAATMTTTMAAATVARAAPPPTVAIAYFDDHSGQPDLAPLGRGLADMLITDLAAVESIRVVEREKLNQALAELKLSRSTFIDPKTAVRLGKGLAAQFILTGGYTVVGAALRIDARLFRVADGQVVAGDKVEGAREEFFSLEKELVELLVNGLELKLAKGEKSRLRANATQSYDAFSRYAAGLEAKDRGDDAKARALFAKALEADPRYAAAKSALERLDALFAHAERTTTAAADAALQSLEGLNPNTPDFARKVEALLLSLDWTHTEQSKRKTALLSSLARQGLVACPKTSGPAPASPHVLHDGVPMGGVISHCRQAHEVLRIANEMLDDPTQWDTLARVCEALIRRLPNDRALLSYCQNTIVAGIREMRGKPDEHQVHDAPNMRAMLRAYAELR